MVVLCGSGGNGGGGLVAARRLFIWGAHVSVVLARPARELAGVPAHQLTILERLGLPLEAPGPGSTLGRRLCDADLVVDALIGYSLRGAPQEPVASLIRAANDAGTPVLALDVPSGLDPDSGKPFEPAIRATATLTLALPKTGLLHPAAREWVGDLFLADISVPEAVYRRLGLCVGPIFAECDIVGLPNR